MTTGGCQCGAVRFAIEVEGAATICHCRMCQKAVGGPFAIHVGAPPDKVRFTRGEPKRFRSSDRAVRGFCPDCGTPLTWEVEGKWTAVSHGALDHPEAFAPTLQICLWDKTPWVDAIADVPQGAPEQEAAARERLSTFVSFQHPDRETEAWPLASE